jgi:uncharacterized repeat protein (TIGR01451 family)
VVDNVQVYVSMVTNPASVGTEARPARVFTAPGPPSAISLEVQKTVDANADGVFAKAESAPRAGAPVTYHVTIKNTSAVPVQLKAVSDFINGTTTQVCGANLNTVLQPGASLPAPCSFTGTAPAAGTTQPDVLIARVVDVNNAANGASVSDTASVSTPR